MIKNKFNFILIFLLSFCSTMDVVQSQEQIKEKDSIDTSIGEGFDQIKKIKKQSREEGQVIDPTEVDLKKATDPNLRINDVIEQDSKDDEAENDSVDNNDRQDESNDIETSKEDFELDEELKSKTLDKLEEQFRKPIYSSKGKRDPFRPFLQAPKEKKGPQITKATPPIKRFPLNQFRLVGIVWMEESAKAMIVDPEKNTYFLGVNDEIGNKNGKIVEVRNNGLLVEEKRIFEDVFGETKVESKKSVLAFVKKEE